MILDKDRLEQELINTRKTFLDTCNLLGIHVELAPDIDLETCSSCSIWKKPKWLRPDLDDNLICNQCFQHYGL